MTARERRDEAHRLWGDILEEFDDDATSVVAVDRDIEEDARVGGHGMMLEAGGGDEEEEERGGARG